MSTPNLAIVHIAANQNQKEVTANGAFDDFDGAITDLLAVAMSDADYTMTTGVGGEALGHLVYKFTGTLTAGRNIIVPVNKKLYVVSNQTTGGHSITVKTPSGTGIALSSSAFQIIYCDGTNVISLSAGGSGASAFTGLSDAPGSYSGSGGEAVEVNSGATALVFSSKPYLPSGYVPGAFAGSQSIMVVPVDRTVNFAANFSGSQATLDVAATASTVFAIYNGSTQIGTITFAIGGTVATFASTSGTAKTLSSGNKLSIVAPSSADATAAGLGFTLQGTR
jgi:hypothetical protein